MRLKFALLILCMFGVAAVLPAQEHLSVALEANSPISAKDFSNANFTGDFTKSGGFLVSGRLFLLGNTGLEVGYGMSRNGLKLRDVVSAATLSLPSDEHSLDVNVVHRFASGRIRPWFMTGTGFITYRPRDAAQANLAQAGFAPISSVTRPKWNFGAGLDFDVLGPLAARVALRNYLTLAPGYSITNNILPITFQAPGSAVVFVEPSIGLVLHF